MQLQGVSCRYPEGLYQRTLWPRWPGDQDSIFALLPVHCFEFPGLISSPVAEFLQGPALPLCLYFLRTQTDRMADTDFPFPVDLLSHQLLPSSPFPCLYVSHPSKPRKTFYLGHPGATPGTDSEALSPGNPQTSHIPQIQRGQRNQETDHPTNKGKQVINAQNHNHSNPR